MRRAVQRLAAKTDPVTMPLTGSILAASLWTARCMCSYSRDPSLEFGDRVVVVIDMESGQRFIIRCEAAIPLPALVHILS